MCKFRNFEKYEVYEDGRIYSYKSKKFLKPNTVKGGYQQVRLFDNEGKPKFYLLHRVIYESVTGEQIPKGMQINHISENKTENMITNLELLSPKQNCNYGSRNKRLSKAISKAKKGIIPKANPPKQVGAYKDGKLVMKFNSTAEAGRNGFNQSSVAACCRNCFNREGNNVYRGFEWRYL